MVAPGIDGPHERDLGLVLWADGIRDAEDQRRDTNAMTDAASTPTRASFCACAGSIASSTMNSEIVKPMPHSAAPPAMPVERQARPEVADPERRFSSAVEPKTPTNLPTTRPTTMPHVSGEVSGADQDLGTERDARVRQREQRQDDVRDVRRVRRLQPFVDRDRLAEAVRGGARVLGVRRLPERAGEFERVLDVATVRDGRPG